MNESRVEIEWHGETLELLAERAVWWAARRTLFVADLHLGKPEHFRLMGTPVPEEVTRHDLDRLSVLIGEYDPERLVVLGDLFHTRPERDGATLRALRAWRESHAALPIVLVRGNHDRRAGDPPGDLGIECLDGPIDDGAFAFVHEPDHAPEGRPALGGHIHPAVRLHGREGGPRLSLRAPCFWVGEQVLVLPAFGRFTGCKCVRPARGDRVFVVNNGRIVEPDGTGAVHA